MDDVADEIQPAEVPATEPIETPEETVPPVAGEPDTLPPLQPASPEETAPLEVSESSPEAVTDAPQEAPLAEPSIQAPEETQSSPAPTGHPGEPQAAEAFIDRAMDDIQAIEGWIEKSVDELVEITLHTPQHVVEALKRLTGAN